MASPSRRSSDVSLGEISAWLLLAGYLAFWGTTEYFHLRGDAGALEKTIHLVLPAPTNDGSFADLLKSLLAVAIKIPATIVGFPYILVVQGLGELARNSGHTLPPIFGPLFSCFVMVVCLVYRFPHDAAAIIGFGLRPLKSGRENAAAWQQHERMKSEVPPMKTSPERQAFNTQMAQFRQQCPDLPTFPDAFQQTDYDGWFQEAYKRWALQAHTRTHAERAAFLKQINELQQLSLNIMRQEGEYQRFDQEQRAQVEQYALEAKRRMVESVKLDMELEALEEERRKRRDPSPAPPTHDPVVEAVAKIRAHLRTEAGVLAELKLLIEEYPGQEKFLKEECHKILRDLRDRR